MKVYIVWYNFYDGAFIHAVFESEDEAKKRVEELNKADKYYDYEGWEVQ